jgi:transcription-repair coupling factor (superfamily II helicase)
MTEERASLRIHLRNLIGSSSSIVASAIYSLMHRPFVFVLNDKEEAAYFQNDLQQFIDKKEVLFLCDSFRKPGHFDDLNNSHVQLRTEVLNRVANSPTKGNRSHLPGNCEKVVNTRR